MFLCKECNSRFFNSFKQGNCHICNGNIDTFLSKVESQLPILKSEITKTFEGAKYFSLSTIIPKEYLIREEDAFDFSAGESLKYFLNAKLRHILETNLNLSYDNSDSDIKISFNFPSGNFTVLSEPIYFLGIYKKLKKDISQKRWNKYENSVESLIGEPVIKILGGTEYFMHASGREDADALNIGGRPFVLEIKNPVKNLSEKLIEQIEKTINSEMIEIKLLGRVTNNFVVLVSDSHFDKSYRAYLDFQNCNYLEKELFEKLNIVCKELSGKIINQQTPLRVMHRRADKIRKRRCYSIIPGKNSEGIYIDIFAEAGTYIKELISGDDDRTKPNISQMMNCNIKCSKLIVKNINYEYLTEMFNYVKL